MPPPTEGGRPDLRRFGVTEYSLASTQVIGSSG